MADATPVAMPPDETRRSDVPRFGTRLARLLQRVTMLANGSDTEATLQQVVGDVCETMGWLAGTSIRLSDRGAARSADAVHVEAPAMGRVLHEVLETSPEAQSAIGQAINSDVAQWIKVDTVQNGSAVPGVLAFPIVVEQQTLAVLVFVATEAVEPDGDLLRSMASVGRQLGVLIERDRARAGVEAANVELARSKRQLDQFAYASHDLQEPLRKIVGFTDLLESRHGNELAGEAAQYFEIVASGARRMQRLLEELLAYTRAGRRQPMMRTVELGDVVADALDDLTVAAANVGGQIRVERPLPTVYGDEGELRQLVTNLVSNALKYRGDTSPTVEVTSARQPDGWWRLTVADNGIGIAPDHHEQIFELFKRLHKRGDYDGTGIGLAVCHQIADRHGGRIWVESEAGDGSAFHVTLPPAAPA